MEFIKNKEYSLRSKLRRRKQVSLAPLLATSREIFNLNRFVRSEAKASFQAPASLANKNWQLLAYKLLTDILTLALITFALLLLMESVLPEIISTHLSFLRFIIFLFLLVVLIAYLGKKNQLDFADSLPVAKKLLFVLAIFFVITLTASLWGFQSWEILAIVFLSLLILFYFYKTLFK